MGKTDFLFLLFAAQAVANEQQVNTKDEGQRTRSETDLAKEDDAEFWDRFLDTFDIDTFSNSVNPSKKKFSFSLSLSEPPTQAPSPAPPGSLAPSVSPSSPPSTSPTLAPSASPSAVPSESPSQALRVLHFANLQLLHPSPHRLHLQADLQVNPQLPHPQLTRVHRQVDFRRRFQAPLRLHHQLRHPSLSRPKFPVQVRRKFLPITHPLRPRKIVNLQLISNVRDALSIQLSFQIVPIVRS